MVNDLITEAERATGEWPEIIALEHVDESVSLGMRIDSQLEWFKGHFPENPILPGVVQVHWSVEFARRLFYPDAAFRRIDNLKFKTVVQPDATLTLTLTPTKDKQIKFVMVLTDSVCSEGRITFE